MPSRHIDRLVRDFVSSPSLYENFDPYRDVQDPTFLSFKIDFFPNLGLSVPLDAYSSGGLFRPSSASAGNEGNTVMSYTFYDSAAEYLYRIGSPARQASLEEFIKLLEKIQYTAPWYFQSVQGLGDIYKIEKSNNYRGKDKVLTVDCLESVDMRMSLLADLYRSVAFDVENWREVLPFNLRTFSMYVHVLEMRKFNTTFGSIADSVASRSLNGENKQKESLQARNIYNSTSALFSGTFNNIGALAGTVNNVTGGLFTNLGEQAGFDNISMLKSAFEAISVQTFSLRECEFDFFTEAPPYLDSVSVKESQEATFRFKINVGRIEKLGFYSFYDYIISEWVKNTRMAKKTLSRTSSGYTVPYFESTSLKQPDRGEGSSPYSTYRDYREAIYPDVEPNAQVEAFMRADRESQYLRRKPLEQALNRLVGNTLPQLNSTINEALGEATGGILGTAPLGNVYGDPNFIQTAVEELNDFLTPGNQITTGQHSYQPPSTNRVNLGNVYASNPGVRIPRT